MNNLHPKTHTNPPYNQPKIESKPNHLVTMFSLENTVASPTIKREIRANDFFFVGLFR
jgi:hypothetical protein